MASFRIDLSVFIEAEDKRHADDIFETTFADGPLYDGSIQWVGSQPVNQQTQLEDYLAESDPSPTTWVNAGELQSALMEVLAAADMRAAMLDSLEPWAANGLREYIAYVQEWAEDNRFIVIQGIGPDGRAY